MTADHSRGASTPPAEERANAAQWVSQETVRLAQAGDPAAIERLLASSHPNVHRFARTLCSTREDAEDATQEAMLILFRRIGTLRAPGALAAWMYRIVVNECLRLARRILTTVADIDATATAIGEDPAVRRMRVETLVNAIATLAPEQRDVLVLRDLNGFSGSETASQLGISDAAMKTRLHRARTKLRRLID